jgi:RNA polymerase sigma factor (sigma-70 family)
MSRFMTNSEVMQLFEKIDNLKEDSTLSEAQKKIAVTAIQNKMIESLGFLVYSNTKQYRRFPNYEDLVQEGFIGLLRAVRKFNRNLFPNFFVYSERWIKHSIKRAASRFDVVYCPNRNRVVYAEPAETGNENNSIPEGPEETYIAKETTQKVREVLNEFSTRDREIIERIFGLDERNPQTLRDIGPTYNLTHERIRQIKNQVILKLRKNESLTELY